VSPTALEQWARRIPRLNQGGHEVEPDDWSPMTEVTVFQASSTSDRLVVTGAGAQRLSSRAGQRESSRVRYHLTDLQGSEKALDKCVILQVNQYNPRGMPVPSREHLTSGL
jgi:hypothetical protein